MKAIEYEEYGTQSITSFILLKDYLVRITHSTSYSDSWDPWGYILIIARFLLISILLILIVIWIIVRWRAKKE
jgi:ABC-type multidrug transport system permease subunit